MDYKTHEGHPLIAIHHRIIFIVTIARCVNYMSMIYFTDNNLISKITLNILSPN